MQPPSGPAASRDPLTLLPDRYAGRCLLETQFTQSVKTKRPLSILLLDIDRFKLINYGYSEHHGDRVLQAIAEVAGVHLRRTDQLIRWGGQEFLFLLPGTDKNAAATLAERLRAAIERIVVPLDGEKLSVTASFGLACHPDNADEPGQLLSAAGAALHRAKSAGRNRVMTATDIRSGLYGAGTLLAQALREGRVMPAFQPIIDLGNGEAVAEEALARIVEPGRPPLEASHFIQVAQELQLTHQIDHAIILKTFAHCLETHRNNVRRAHFVNISVDLLRHPRVIDNLLDAANHYSASCRDQRIDTNPVVIELTERELIDDTHTVRDLLAPFLDFGLRLALDDFGSGYSSYRYLADLPFSFLKIEGSLIRRVDESKVRHIIRGIQRTAAELGLTTIAEFVEDAATADIVRDLGIDWAQGYYFGKPSIPTSPEFPAPAPATTD